MKLQTESCWCAPAQAGAWKRPALRKAPRPIQNLKRSVRHSCFFRAPLLDLKSLFLCICSIINAAEFSKSQLFFCSAHLGAMGGAGDRGEQRSSSKAELCSRAPSCRLLEPGSPLPRHILLWSFLGQVLLCRSSTRQALLCHLIRNLC